MHSVASVPLRDPIVLVHGLSGFDRLLTLRRPLNEYFPGIARHLSTVGNRVYLARVSPTAGIARRAADLKRWLEREVPAGRLHLVGHSLGGLDARYLVSRLGMDNRVASITTIGTPHRGSTFADWSMRWLGRLFIPVLRRLGIPYQAFYDLMTENCRRFNEEVPDVPGVRYFAIAGRCEKPWLLPEWRLPHAIVERAEGPNDGVVSVASARWGEQTELWDGDHLNLVNWPNRLERRRGVWTDRGAAYSRHFEKLVRGGVLTQSCRSRRSRGLQQPSLHLSASVPRTESHFSSRLSFASRPRQSDGMALRGRGSRIESGIVGRLVFRWQGEAAKEGGDPGPQ